MLCEDGGETVLRPGDAAGWKAESPTAITGQPRRTRDAVYLEVGTRAKRERAHYPDVDLVDDKDENGVRFSHRSGEPYRRQEHAEERPMTYVNFKLDIDADGIALVTWDVPGRSMNVIDLDGHRGTRGPRGAARGRCRGQGRGHHLGQGQRSAPAPISRCWTGRPHFADAGEGARRGSGRGARCSRRAASCRCSTGGSRPAASRGSRRSTAPRSAAASSCASPAITASPPTIRRRASGCPRSRSGCFRAPAARSASRA